MRARTVIAFAAGIVATLVVGLVVDAGNGEQASVDVAIGLTTVEAQTRTIRTYVSYDGTLEIGSTERLAASRNGTVTDTAAPGTVLEPGDALMRIDDQPVTLLIGEVPMYRTLESGDEGADVGQLETFLALGGYDTASPITIDETFTSATAAALGAWQEEVGLEVTGTMTRGSFVVVPGPVEVLEVSSVGDDVRDGSALATVSTGPVVTVDVVDGDARPLAPVATPATPTITLSVVPDEVDNFALGAVVEVETADGVTHEGAVTGVGSVAVSDPQTPDDPAGVAVSIEIDASGEVLAGPAHVRVVESERVDVIAVPTRALVALAEGGQAVEIVDGNRQRRLVGVELGVFADGWVEVTSDTEGGAVAAGIEVAVPA